MNLDISRLSENDRIIFTDYLKNHFENLVTNLIHKGLRPKNISSTGAAFVFGKITRFIILSAKPYSNITAKTLRQ